MQAKMQWLRNSNQSTVENINSVSGGNKRHVRKKKHMQVIIDELKNHSKKKKF
jgi:hypothetical protein